MNVYNSKPRRADDHRRRDEGRARCKRPPPNSRRRSRCSRPRPGGSPNSCHAWTTASRGWPTPKTGSAGRWRRSSTAAATPTACPTRSPPRDHHRPAEAPEHQRGGDTRRRHRPGTDPEPRRHTMDRPGPARRVPRRAADLMEKRARPRSKRPRPRSGRGVRCTRHPCRQASLRVSPRRGAGRLHPLAMGGTQCDSMGCSTRPGRVPPVGSCLPARRQPASLPSCHRPGRTGPGLVAARPGREGYPGRFWLMGDTLHRFSQKYLVNSSISALYLQYRPHFKAWLPLFLPSGESRIFTG